MVIRSIAPTSYSGMYKIVPQEGAAFFIRPEYLISLDFDSIQSEVEMNEDETNELLDAGFTAVVELKAVDYLAGRLTEHHPGKFRIEEYYESYY